MGWPTRRTLSCVPEGEIDQLRGELAELRRSRKRLAEATTADRQAFERAFHDGVQQHLVALAVDLQRLAKLVDGHPADAKALVDEMAANLRDALAEGKRRKNRHEKRGS